MPPYSMKLHTFCDVPIPKSAIRPIKRGMIKTLEGKTFNKVLAGEERRNSETLNPESLTINLSEP